MLLHALSHDTIWTDLDYTLLKVVRIYDVFSANIFSDFLQITHEDVSKMYFIMLYKIM